MVKNIAGYATPICIRRTLCKWTSTEDLPLIRCILLRRKRLFADVMYRYILETLFPIPATDRPLLHILEFFHSCSISLLFPSCALRLLTEQDTTGLCFSRTNNNHIITSIFFLNVHHLTPPYIILHHYYVFSPKALSTHPIPPPSHPPRRCFPCRIPCPGSCPRRCRRWIPWQRSRTWRRWTSGPAGLGMGMGMRYGNTTGSEMNQNRFMSYII